MLFNIGFYFASFLERFWEVFGPKMEPKWTKKQASAELQKTLGASLLWEQFLLYVSVLFRSAGILKI